MKKIYDKKRHAHVVFLSWQECALRARFSDSHVAFQMHFFVFAVKAETDVVSGGGCKSTVPAFDDREAGGFHLREEKGQRKVFW